MWRPEWRIDGRWFGGWHYKTKTEALRNMVWMRRMGYPTRVSELGKATGEAK